MATPPPVTDTIARFVAGTDYSTISDKPSPTPKCICSTRWALRSWEFQRTLHLSLLITANESAIATSRQFGEHA